ncbi:hypothetical protein [Microbacterium hydrocarbonoxydans]|uniref:hypothetical protein n=1 Tax=Microbacterium hydrocarbonoxydans TaxID=273678 RepID=UPI00203E16F7|nr:hypothetical protein [Microbacterium hydrocarbonoxydans]MCM3781313.1 hypothetical protein [Microbacterium hydrocarbonoxydans]
MSSTKNDRALSRGDVAALVGFCLAGAVIAIYFTVSSIIRIIELAGGQQVPVAVEFLGDSVDLPLSTGGTIAVALESGTITAPQLPLIAIVPGIIAQVVQIITVVVVVSCLILLARRTIGGRIFGRGRTALVATAGITGLLGFAAVRFFDNMLANATISRVTDNGIDNAVITVEPFTFILGAFVVALITTVFSIGDRLQKDTEGLV